MRAGLSLSVTVERDCGVGRLTGERVAQRAPQAIDISAYISRLATQEFRRLIRAAARADTDVWRRERQPGPQVGERHTLVGQRDKRIRCDGGDGRKFRVKPQQMIERVGKLNADGHDMLR